MNSSCFFSEYGMITSNMMYFILGIIVGILVRDIKTKTVLYIDKLEKDYKDRGGSQFIESKSIREKFDEAVELEDLLE